jgi:hypothetical protein
VLHKVITVALESDPGVQYGKSGAVDGFTFKKHRATYELSRIAENVVTGDWNERGAAYTKIFGQLPVGWSAVVGGLEQGRKIRNGVGHAFGRDTKEYEDHWHLMPRRMVTVSHTDLLGWPGLMEKLALAIDQHLGPAHVGEYETRSFLHNWKPTKNELGQGKARSLSRLLQHGWAVPRRNVLQRYRCMLRQSVAHRTLVRDTVPRSRTNATTDYESADCTRR